MTPPPLDLSQTEYPAFVQANLIAYMRLFAGLPGIVMHDDDAFWIVSNRPAPGDAILRAHWSAVGSEARLDATLAEVGQHCAEIGWMVFPGDQPADLGLRLAVRGLPSGPGGNWLWADLAALAPAPAVPAGFRVKPVRDDQALAEWVRLSATGFGVDVDCYFDAYARHGYGPEAQSLHYLGYLDGTPVTSGTLLDAGGTASIYDVSTPPEFRRQGFGGALTHALMRAIRERGYPHTWIWSSNVGKSVYRRLGYVDADFGLREYTWRKLG
jgi:ribosomal protein S18 acetylase RimI-like enzyme